MKYFIAMLMVLLLTACSTPSKSDITTKCVKTDLWVYSSGHATTRPVYDCSGVNFNKDYNDTH